MVHVSERYPNGDEKQIKAKQIYATEDRCMLLSQDSNDLYVWGGNERGQLGLGHYQDISQPTKVQFFAKQNLKLHSIASGGNLTLAATKTGESYAWPFQM